jgi:predicted nucleic acid-binding Zn ribbon protein
MGIATEKQKTCIVCEVIFDALSRGKTAKTCSEKCSKELRAKNNKNWNAIFNQFSNVSLNGASDESNL